MNPRGCKLILRSIGRGKDIPVHHLGSQSWLLEHPEAVAACLKNLLRKTRTEKALALFRAFEWTSAWIDNILKYVDDLMDRRNARMDMFQSDLEKPATCDYMQYGGYSRRADAWKILLAEETDRCTKLVEFRDAITSQE